MWDSFDRIFRTVAAVGLAVALCTAIGWGYVFLFCLGLAVLKLIWPLARNPLLLLVALVGLRQ